MSEIQVVNQAEEAWLDLITDVDMTLRLYRNNVTSGLTDEQIEALTQASFTEANFAGYAASSMTTSWTTTQGNPSTATRAQVSFIRSSTGTAQLIYGYYVTRNSDGALQWFEHFDGPISVEFINDTVNVTPTLTLDDRSGNMGTPIGGSILWSGSSAAIPSGWLLRNGQAVSRTTYALLFAVIGTTYGAGDGSTTFNVPDSRQRFPLGVAASGTGATLGGTGGAIDHTHALNSSTAHAQLHATGVATAGIRIKRVTVSSWTDTAMYTATGQAVANDTQSQTTGVALAGSTDTGNPPFLAEHFIIRAL